MLLALLGWISESGPRSSTSARTDARMARNPYHFRGQGWHTFLRQNHNDAERFLARGTTSGAGWRGASGFFAPLISPSWRHHKFPNQSHAADDDKKAIIQAAAGWNQPTADPARISPIMATRGCIWVSLQALGQDVSLATPGVVLSRRTLLHELSQHPEPGARRSGQPHSNELQFTERLSINSILYRSRMGPGGQEPTFCFTKRKNAGGPWQSVKSLFPRARARRHRPCQVDSYGRATRA